MVRRLISGAGIAALLIPGAMLSGAAGADEPDGVERFESAPSAGLIDPVILPASMDDSRTVTVMVQLQGEPVAVREAAKGRELSKSEKSAIKKSLKAAQDAAADQIEAKGGTVRSQMQSAYNGMRVTIPRSKVPSLASVSGVVAVRAVPDYELDHETSVPYLGVPQVWEDTGYTGENVKVAIIDTGIDYTHANFGGPGTEEAYDAALAASTAPANPAWFGPAAPRVKGGWDFVGDDYDANVDGSVPQPDPNPLDCQGHGSHVAGTTGGSGVLPDGSTYDGPYDGTTFETDFEIGPGVAPEVDLYALRVFGCDGSTNVTTEAIDWAVDNDMDVINMSLGSAFGQAGDPSAEASTNAVAAGVVVVTSSGNSGPNPYITGAPGAGDGAISVAAVDSTASFPGANLTFGSTTIPAINANGENIPASSYEIVVLTDDPATPANEALGCQASDYTQAGISSTADAPLQMAVTVRGTCARVARAVYGQQAGADAVVMINSDAGFPPYEGEITSNPDTGEEYEVTIPFLGVRGVLGPAPTDDGDALMAADGQSVTMAPITIPNPSFRAFASFSSGGPRTGDSAAKPNVAAPGVSIYSTAVGTGWKGGVNSGTSMAAPHVAGVAALGVQAHPEWSSEEVSAAVVNTADPSGVADYRLTRAGTGLVDTAQTVSTSAVAFGDSVETADGLVRVPTLSFGFAESATTFTGTKTVSLVNKGTSAKTFSLSTAPSPQSRPATVTVSPSTVTVPAGGSMDVQVTLTASASAVPSSVSGPGGQHKFYEVSGNVVATSDEGVLRVSYLMVPRSLTKAQASAKGNINTREGGTPVTLTNPGGALPAQADFYTWGLSDSDDVDEAALGGLGYDLRAVGAQSFPFGSESDRLIVFAVNNWSRWSNASVNEYDIYIDVNRDGTDDYIVFAYDSGALRTGSFNGLTEVFYADLATNALGSTGFLATAPTDSSTLLMPVEAATLGITDATGPFDYTAVSFSGLSAGSDSVKGSATYDAWSKAMADADGDFVTIPPNGTVTYSVTVDKAAWKLQRPLGLMIVVLDNAAGASEALLLKGS